MTTQKKPAVPLGTAGFFQTAFVKRDAALRVRIKAFISGRDKVCSEPFSFDDGKPPLSQALSVRGLTGPTAREQ